jgi:hypothetical protein
VPFNHKIQSLERRRGDTIPRRTFFLLQPLLWAGAVAALTTSLAVSTSSSQTTALNRVMRQKLEQSQGMLAAVVTSNWPDLERRSEALIRITNDPAWMVLNSPEYARQSQAFLRAAQDLVDAAKRRDLDAAPLAYVALTLSCVQCHRYVARARIATDRARGLFEILRRAEPDASDSTKSPCTQDFAPPRNFSRSCAWG